MPELRAGVPGEIMLGVSEAGFRRSAFISGADMALDANAELEKNIEDVIDLIEKNNEKGRRAI